MRISALVLALASLLVAVPAVAVDRVVDKAGGPCVPGVPIHATINGAIAAASPGETILVCAGDYSENVVVDKANLTLQAQGVVHVKALPGSGPAILVSRGGVTIQGFDVAGATHTCGVFVASTDGADIKDNRVHDNGTGICFSGGGNHRARYNEVLQNEVGIEIFQTLGPVDLSNNTVKDSIFGMYAICRVPGVMIDHNAVTASSRWGIFVNSCDRVVITNNTVRGPGATANPSVRGIEVWRSTEALLTRNLVQQTGIGLRLLSATGATASFNSASFNGVGLDVAGATTGATVTRNNVSRSTTVDCRWDGVGVNVLTGNSCGTQDPAGVFD